MIIKYKRKNIELNVILNVIKSSMSVLFSIITYPYALRVLGSKNIGKVQYGSSIVSYFSFLAMLGVVTYGIREGAKLREDKNRLSIFINELFTINIISTIISYFLLGITIWIIPKLHSYALLILIQSSSIIFTTLGVDWINTIFEDYLLVTVRSIGMHVISTLLLFLLVKSPEDYYVYAFLVVLGNIIICITNWFYIRRYIKPSLTLKPHFKVHLKPLLLIFANFIAISIYVNFDITMLGWIKGDTEVGLYSASAKIYSIIKSILAAIYAVFIPRLSSYQGNFNKEKYKKLYSELWCYLSILVMPASIGLICVAPEVMMFMGGKEYILSAGSLQILAVALMFAIYGGLLTAVLNITLGREKVNLIATLIAAAINAILNFITIPLIGQYGAALTTAISEAFVFIYCFRKTVGIHNYIDISKIKNCILQACIGSIFIVGIRIWIQNIINEWIIRLIITILFGVTIYGLVLYLMHNYIVYDLVLKISSKIKVKRKI